MQSNSLLYFVRNRSNSRVDPIENESNPSELFENGDEEKEVQSSYGKTCSTTCGEREKCRGKKEASESLFCYHIFNTCFTSPEYLFLDNIKGDGQSYDGT
mmetsp:Transcript_7794/g.15674  ORF Transcript_7794/g.15674 Transcript_7794/m.15674 type:complete len:100 (-) Transcript_7794:172-471(-)